MINSHQIYGMPGIVFLSSRIAFAIIMVLSLFNLPAFGQSRIDSLSNKIDQLEKRIAQFDSLPAKIEKESEKINSNYNNIITNQGNYIGWVSLLLTGVSVFFGIVAIKSFLDSNKAKKEVENTLSEIKGNAELALNKSREVLNDTLKSETELKGIIASIAIQEKGIKDELSKLKEEKNLIQSEIEEIKEKATHFIKEIDERFKKEADKTLELIDLYNQAYEKMNLGSVKIAISKFKKILSYNENHVGAKCKLAMCYSSLDRNARAIEVISRYANNENEHSAIYSTFAVILRREGEYDRALKYFTKALEGEFKDNHTTYSHIGYTWFFKRNYEKANEYFSKSLEKEDNNSPSTYGMLKSAMMQNHLGDNSRLIKLAHTNAQRDINEHPKYPFPYFGLAFVEVLSNDANCLDSMKEAIRLCKNIGILKEQLFEYNLFMHLKDHLKHVKGVVDLLNNEITRLNILYQDV